MRGWSGASRATGKIIDEGGPAANPDIFYDIRQKTGVDKAVKPDPAKDYQLVTFRFSTPLRGLIFSIARIDQSADRIGGPDVIDTASLASKVSYTSKPARIPGDSNPSIVTGIGSVSNPWRSLALDTENITLRGQIDIFFSETEYVQEFTLRVANLSTNRAPRSNDQRIAVRGFLGWRDLC